MKRLIIGPGAMYIYSFMGVMKYLQDTGKLADLEELSCSSAGAVLGFFYLLTHGDFEKIFEIQSKINFEEASKIDIKNLIHKFGFIRGENFEKIIANSSVIDPTFKELYDINPIKFYVTTHELITNKTYYMSIDTTPDMKVSHALRRSISVPLLFTPCIEDHKIYIDGSSAIYNPYEPFLCKDDVCEIRAGWGPTIHKTPKNLFQYLKILAATYSRMRYDYLDFKRIEVYPPNIDMFNFKMSEAEKYDLYIDGYTVGMNSH